jgi:hypothetical protein
MAGKVKKYDGVIEAVRYDPAGKIDWVRAYERYGFVFSDKKKLDRQTLIERLKAGERFLVGHRVTYMGNDFEVSEPVKLVQRNGDEYILAGESQGNQDHLKDVPII